MTPHSPRCSGLALAAFIACGCTSQGSARHDASDAGSAQPAPRDGGGPQGATRDARHGELPDAGVAAKRDATRVEPRRETGAASGDAHVAREASSTASDGASAHRDAAPEIDAGAPDAGIRLVHIPGWSVRKHVLEPDGAHLVLEEVLTSFTEAPLPDRIQRLGRDGAVRQSYVAPAGSYLSDFCEHPSGDVSAVLIDAGQVVSLVRLSASLTPLTITPIHDPDVPTDLRVDGGPKDLFANGFASDAARIASVGEDVVAVVYSSFFSVIAYRGSYAGGSWSSLARTLVEPPRPLTPFLPISGSFDTFGAIVAWFRAVLDTDEEGNAYVAIWANPVKIRAHTAAFQDGLAPLHAGNDSDVLLTRLNRDGARAWSRVIGNVNEDEPYAVRAAHGQVAVVGRSRRQPGFDNTFWDAFVSVSSTGGDLVGTRAIAFDSSSILLAADVTPSGTWVFGGSDAWSQNPDGLSVLTFGNKLLFELPALDGDPVRLAVPAGPRHNEVHDVAVDATHVWYAGHEDGPVMHTGDADPSLIHATGVLGQVDR